MLANEFTDISLQFVLGIWIYCSNENLRREWLNKETINGRPRVGEKINFNYLFVWVLNTELKVPQTRI